MVSTDRSWMIIEVTMIGRVLGVAGAVCISPGQNN